MRASALTLFAVGATLATAQQQMGNIPTCATGCISSSLPAQCNLNPQCICADTSFITTISCCVSKACDIAGQQAALAYAKQICAPVGVTNLPTAAGCSAGAASATAVTASGSKTTASAAMSSLASTASAKTSVVAGAAATMGPMGMAGIAALGALAIL